MWLSTEPGEGTTFTIALPLVSAEGGRVVEPQPVRQGGTETILLVDDEDAVREVLARGLEEQGYRLLEASDGAHALEILKQTPDAINLVVTDVAMPGMNGLELARRAIELRGFLPFVFVSGQPREVVSEMGQLQEEHTLLEKPFSPDVLAACIRAVLDQQTASARA
jgi:DNA-binding response OmpR family regulator